MNKATDEIVELSPRRRLVCNLCSAGVVLAAGLILLLCGVDVLPAKVSEAVCGVLLCAVGLMFAVSAFIGSNSVSLWLGCCFLVPALVELLVKTTKYGYAELYPLYIGIPAVASLVTMCFTRQWRGHLPVIALFGVTAAIFALKSSGVAKWSIVVPVLVLYAGCLMLLLALKARKKDEEDVY